MTNLIQGGGGGGKGGGAAAAHQPVEDPNTLRSLSTAWVLDLLGQGEIEGWPNQSNPFQYVYLNTTVVQNADGSDNFNGIGITMASGTPTQSYIPGYTLSSPLPVGGAEFHGGQAAFSGNSKVAARSYVAPKQYVRSINDLDASALRVIIGIPALTNLDETTGDMHGNTVDVQIEVTNFGSSGWQTAVQDTITGKCVATYERAYRVELPQPGPWSLRISRQAEISHGSNEQKTTNVDAVIKLIDEKYSYPNYAYVGMAIDPTYFSGSIPNRNYFVRGLKISVPNNYDPVSHTYTSPVWNGGFITHWSSNPAWILYDLLTHPTRGVRGYD